MHNAASAGEMPVYEPGLAELVARNVLPRNGSPSAHLIGARRSNPGRSGHSLRQWARPAPVSDGHADTDLNVYAGRPRDRPMRWKVIRELIGDQIHRSPSGHTATSVEAAIIREDAPGMRDFRRWSSNPEFTCVTGSPANQPNFKRPDRIVIGIEDERAREPMIQAYRPLHLNHSADALHRAAHGRS